MSLHRTGRKVRLERQLELSPPLLWREDAAEPLAEAAAAAEEPPVVERREEVE